MLDLPGVADCPKCYFDLKAYDDAHENDDHAALVPQEAAVKTLRTGTKKLLQTGMDRVKVMTEHCVKPQFIHRSLRADAHREALVLGTMAQTPPTVRNTHLIEWCCHNDSELMNQ